MSTESRGRKLEYTFAVSVQLPGKALPRVPLSRLIGALAKRLGGKILNWPRTGGKLGYRFKKMENLAAFSATLSEHLPKISSVHVTLPKKKRTKR